MQKADIIRLQHVSMQIYNFPTNRLVELHKYIHITEVGIILTEARTKQAARNGVLIKGGMHLENLGAVKTRLV